MTDLEARVKALESSISLEQLPLAALLDRLESDWNPDGNSFLLPKSVGNPLLATDAVDDRVLAKVKVLPITYTVATLPAAAAHTGEIVFVSDGAAGTKFRGSDGAAWVNLG